MRDGRVGSQRADGRGAESLPRRLADGHQHVRGDGPPRPRARAASTTARAREAQRSSRRPAARHDALPRPASPPRGRRRARLQRAGRAAGLDPPAARLPLRAAPVLVADRHRRQREHRRHAARSPPRWPRDLAGRRGARPARARAAAARCARRGSASDADVLCYMDVDLSTDLRALLPLRRAAGLRPQRRRDRHAPGAAARASSAAPGASSSRAPTTACCTSTLGARFSDAQCGFKAVRADVARAAAARRARRRRGSSTPSCSCSPSARACASTRCPVDWVDDPDSRVDIVRTALDDLRGIARLLAAARLTRFLAIGVASTIAYAVALPAAARRRSAPARANALALALTAVANTAGQPPPDLRRARARGPAAPARRWAPSSTSSRSG